MGLGHIQMLFPKPFPFFPLFFPLRFIISYYLFAICRFLSLMYLWITVASKTKYNNLMRNDIIYPDKSLSLAFMYCCLNKTINTIYKSCPHAHFVSSC